MRKLIARFRSIDRLEARNAKAARRVTRISDRIELERQRSRERRAA